MRVLITGANGQLGWELQRIKPENWQAVKFNHAELDISDSAAVETVFQKYKPDLVINAAAYTAVDKAESEKDIAYKVNAEGVENVARASAKFQARLIHISTDFVFDGNKSQPYLPGDKPNPTGVYGASKLQGEQGILEETPPKA